MWAIDILLLEKVHKANSRFKIKIQPLTHLDMLLQTLNHEKGINFKPAKYQVLNNEELLYI